MASATSETDRLSASAFVDSVVQVASVNWFPVDPPPPMPALGPLAKICLALSDVSFLGARTTQIYAAALQWVIVSASPERERLGVWLGLGKVKLGKVRLS